MNTQHEIDKALERITSYQDMIERLNTMLASMKAQRMAEIARVGDLRNHQEMGLDEAYRKATDEPDSSDQWEIDQAQTDDILIYRIEQGS